MVKSHGDGEHTDNAREVSSCAKALIAVSASAVDILASNATSSIINNNICLTYKY
jgi:hypothetical protein